MIVNYAGNKCEVGFHAPATSGNAVFTRCPSCGQGYHIVMVERAPWVKCPKCSHVKVRPV